MELLLALGAIIISFTLVIISVPPILRVARAKHLFESFDNRKVHTDLVPPLGGVAIFIGFILSIIIVSYGLNFDLLKYIIASVVLMFFIGLKDDLITISPRKKLSIQIFAALILIVLGNIRFTNLHGLLGIYEINYFPSILISLFLIVTVVNAFNLIDGIDGLASGLAMLATFVFGVWFYMAASYQLSIISFALVGSLFGFFLYNVFGHTNKLFMGDTGSLITGIVISILVIKFNELNIIKNTPLAINAAPAVSFAIIIIPMVDTLRVMAIRIAQKRSPFSADRNHIHHILLKLNHNHLKVTTLLVTTNIFIIGFALLLNNLLLNINVQFLILFLVGIVLSLIPTVILKIKSTTENELQNQHEQVQYNVPRMVAKKYYFSNQEEGLNSSRKLNNSSQKVRKLDTSENKNSNLKQRKIVHLK